MDAVAREVMAPRGGLESSLSARKHRRQVIVSFVAMFTNPASQLFFYLSK